MKENLLKDINQFIVENLVYVPSDDEGNSYQKASNIQLTKAYIEKSDNNYRPESIYYPEDMEEYKDEMENFIEVFILRY